MSQKSREQQLATAASYFVKALSRFQGPNTDEALKVCQRILKVLPQENGNGPRVFGPRRPVPPGTFEPDRNRQLVIGEVAFPAPTIAKGVCNVFEYEQANGETIDDLVIAKAVQKAFPENNYCRDGKRTDRVVIDRQKWARGQFGFQK